MDYLIRRDPSALDSTGYVEIGPGQYAGKHWQPGFVFVWEDAFGLAEGILRRHLPSYDHYDMNDVPREVGLPVCAEWRVAASQLPGWAPSEAVERLGLNQVYLGGWEAELAAHGKEIARMLESLAEDVEGFYRQGDWVCILGI